MVAAEPANGVLPANGLDGGWVVRACAADSRARGGRDGQVLLRWCVQRDLAVVMKIFDFTLSSDGMAALDALDETGGTERALERRRW